MVADNKTPGWTVAALWGAVLAVAALAIFLPFFPGSAAGQKSGDIFTLPFLLVCIAGVAGGLSYYFITNRGSGQWWRRPAGVLLYLALVAAGFAVVIVTGAD